MTDDLTEYRELYQPAQLVVQGVSERGRQKLQLNHKL